MKIPESLLKKSAFAFLAINIGINLYLSNIPAAVNAFAACWFLFVSGSNPNPRPQ